MPSVLYKSLTLDGTMNDSDETLQALQTSRCRAAKSLRRVQLVPVSGEAASGLQMEATRSYWKVFLSVAKRWFIFVFRACGQNGINAGQFRQQSW